MWTEAGGRGAGVYVGCHAREPELLHEHLVKAHHGHGALRGLRDRHGRYGHAFARRSRFSGATCFFRLCLIVLPARQDLRLQRTLNGGGQRNHRCVGFSRGEAARSSEGAAACAHQTGGEHFVLLGGIPARGGDCGQCGCGREGAEQEDEDGEDGQGTGSGVRKLNVRHVLPIDCRCRVPDHP